MQLLIIAVVISIILTIVLRKYYYTSTFFKKFKKQQQKQGKFLHIMFIWEFFTVLTGLYNFIGDQNHIFSSFHTLITDTVIPTTIFIGLIGIWQWKKWGAYVLFIGFGVLFVETIISFSSTPQYLIGLPQFIIISIINDGLWYWALKRKWKLFN